MDTVGPNPMTGALIRGNLDKETQEEGHVKIEAEIVVMQLQTKECQGLLVTS